MLWAIASVVLVICAGIYCAYWSIVWGLWTWEAFKIGYLVREKIFGIVACMVCIALSIFCFVGPFI